MKAWDAFLTSLEGELGAKTVTKWLRSLKLLRFDACNLYLEAPHSFQSAWFEEHIQPEVDRRLVNNNGKQIRVHLSVAQSEKEKQKETPTKRNRPAFNPSVEMVFDEIDKEATFKNFVSSKSNLLAHKLLSDLDPKVPPDFNPIYLFGRRGVGKTHLLMSTAHLFKEVKLNYLYVRAETFTEHVVGAIRQGNMQAFRKAYRKADALFIDDVHLFSRKGATQEELFHTFNALHTDGKQIILTANCPPSELKFIEPRLVSRFEWGIVIPVQPSMPHETLTILHKRAAKANFTLDDNVAQFLVATFTSSLKALLRAFDALLLRLHLNQNLGHRVQDQLTVDESKKILKDLIQEEEKSVLTPVKIIRNVADYYGIRIDDILSKSQVRESVLPRQIAMHLCRKTLNLPYMKIGDLFSRDHSTVMSSVKLVENNLNEKNAEITTPVHSILKKLEIPF